MDGLGDLGGGAEAMLADRDSGAAPRAERRLQVRAYNLWAGLLGDRPLPAASELASEAWAQFAEFSVLVAADGGLRDPEIRYLGARLAGQCGGKGALARVSAVPPGSVLGSITRRVPQVLASAAPVGFATDLIGEHGATLLCRGILLPFARADGAIGCVWGAVNWKQVAERELTEALHRELRAATAPPPRRDPDAPIAAWADGPLDGDGAAAPAPACADARAHDPERLAHARTLGRGALAARAEVEAALGLALAAAHDLCAPADARADAAALAAVFGPGLDRPARAVLAAVLAHARRRGVSAGALPALIAATPGGIAALARAERRERRRVSVRVQPPIG